MTAAAAGSSAWAADLPVYKAPPVVPAFSWTGFYIGANVGYGWARGQSWNTINGVTTTSSGKMNGVVGGGQLGYNWQTGNFVLGVEVDGQGSDSHQTFSFVVRPGIVATRTNKIPWFATARGRVGWAFADRWMVYATGGGGWLDFKSDLAVPTLGNYTFEKTHAAWVVGAGIEQAFAQNWSWKVEYLHMDTGRFLAESNGIVHTDLRLKDNIVRGGINYHF